jgi:ADP-heptose:LPS heptosyltransferase
MSRIAVIKPDHLGDLILAQPAISYIQSRAGEIDLFVQSSLGFLARHLFPHVAINSLDFAHLNKQGTDNCLPRELKDLDGYELIYVLREDESINRMRLGAYLKRAVFVGGHDRQHETHSHRIGLRPYLGDYIPRHFSHSVRRPFVTSPALVGLCLGSGFPANKWSIIKWHRLGKALQSQGRAIRLLGGPGESSELAIIQQLLGLDEGNVVVGSYDVDRFLSRVAECDLVVASDGGSGHLCSLVSPVLTVAGSVPFRRYAPFGEHHRVLSLDLPCSPCLNAHETRINACFSYECSYGISVVKVLQAISAAHKPAGTTDDMGDGAKLFHGVSIVEGAS